MKLMGMVLLVGVAAAAACDSSGGVKSLGERKSPGVQSLEQLQRGAKAAFAEKAAFPIGKVGPTPSATCCDSPGMKCPASAALWQDPIWQALGFSVTEDQPFRYSYESADGKRFTAKAISDVDCDMSETEIVLVGNSEGGTPTFDLVMPPRID